MYSKGEGVEKNEELAAQWLRRAEVQTDKKATCKSTFLPN